jgi:NitT/TauT family transport system substrate-binding protein
VYAHDRNSGLKLLAGDAWFVSAARARSDAFLLKAEADAWAGKHGGKVSTSRA